MEMAANNVEGLPDALTARAQWVCWRREERDGKTTKVPVDPATGDYASTTEPGTWTNVATTLEAVEGNDVDGVGFVFTDDDPLVGVDLDECRDPDSGTIDEWARDIVTRLDSYAEVSPSGTGVHVIAAGELPDGRSRKDDVEMYETSRFFTVTGEHLDATPKSIERRVDAIRGVHADYVREQPGEVEDESDDDPAEAAEGGVDLQDDELIERARSAKNGDRFEALFQGRTDGYDSHSEADMALCLHLAFWTGGEPSRMDALFRQSGLLREKWDEVHYADGATYGERTIERALDRVDEVYETDAGGSKSDDSTSTSPTEARGDARDGSSSRTMRDESVYLEERNRLLREKVRAQQATIDEQAARISELERELEVGRIRATVCEGADQPPPESRGRLDLLTWLGIR